MAALISERISEAFLLTELSFSLLFVMLGCSGHRLALLDRGGGDPPALLGAAAATFWPSSVAAEATFLLSAAAPAGTSLALDVSVDGRCRPRARSEAPAPLAPLRRRWFLCRSGGRALRPRRRAPGGEVRCGETANPAPRWRRPVATPLRASVSPRRAGPASTRHRLSRLPPTPVGGSRSAGRCPGSRRSPRPSRRGPALPPGPDDPLWGWRSGSRSSSSMRVVL